MTAEEAAAEMFAKAVDKFARVSALNAEIEGYKAENAFRLQLGQSVAYCEDSFAILAREIHEISKE